MAVGSLAKAEMACVVSSSPPIFIVARRSCKVVVQPQPLILGHMRVNEQANTCTLHVLFSVNFTTRSGTSRLVSHNLIHKIRKSTFLGYI